MKILPCANCPDGLARAGTQPYYCASFPGQPGHPLRYTCTACRRTSTIQVGEFHVLPDASRDDLERLGVLAHVSQDLTLGHELQIEQAKDLFLAGFTPADVAALPVQDREQRGTDLAVNKQHPQRRGSQMGEQKGGTERGGPANTGHTPSKSDTAGGTAADKGKGSDTSKPASDSKDSKDSK